METVLATRRVFWEPWVLQVLTFRTRLEQCSVEFEEQPMLNPLLKLTHYKYAQYSDFGLLLFRNIYLYLYRIKEARIGSRIKICTGWFIMFVPPPLAYTSSYTSQ